MSSMSSKKLLTTVCCILICTLPARTSDLVCKDLEMDSSRPLLGDIPVPVGHNCRTGILNHLCMEDARSYSVPPVFQSMAESCKSLRNKGCTKSGIYYVKPGVREFCEMSILDGGWTLILRQMNNSREFLTKNFDDFKSGFGNFSSTFWRGLDSLHERTSTGNYELYVGMENSRGKLAFACYGSFSVGDEASGYKLSLGEYTGPASWGNLAGDALSKSNNNEFVAQGSGGDNEECGATHGGWWYTSCRLPELYSVNYKRWHPWSQGTDLRSFTMYIREL